MEYRDTPGNFKIAVPVEQQKIILEARTFIDIYPGYMACKTDTESYSRQSPCLKTSRLMIILKRL